MHYPKAKQKLICLAVASACAAVAVPGFAQDASTAKAAETNKADTSVAGTEVQATRVRWQVAVDPAQQPGTGHAREAEFIEPCLGELRPDRCRYRLARQPNLVDEPEEEFRRYCRRHRRLRHR